jgi:membrane protein
METLAQIVNSILSLALITVLFAMIFKFLPDAKVAWHDVMDRRLHYRYCPS